MREWAVLRMGSGTFRALQAGGRKPSRCAIPSSGRTTRPTVRASTRPSGATAGSSAPIVRPRLAAPRAAPCGAGRLPSEPEGAPGLYARGPRRGIAAAIASGDPVLRQLVYSESRLKGSAPMTLRNRPGRGPLPIPAPGSWSPRRAAAGACVCRSCSAGCGSGVSEKAGAPCARGKAQRCAQRTIPRYRSGQNQPQASTATQSSAGIGPNGLLAPPHGLRISGRPLRPDRAYCKTARKFLCFILMKRIPRGLAVDN